MGSVLETIWKHALELCRSLGFFRLSEFGTAKYLKILCYHGFDPDGPNMFSNIFMTPTLFEERMRWLKSRDYNVISLDSAVQLFEQGRLPKRSVVLTFDDGFYSFYKDAAPVLRELGFSATVYVTSYYVKHSGPIFRLGVQHVVYQSGKVGDSLLETLSPFLGRRTVPGENTHDAIWELIERAERGLEEIQRQELLLRLGEAFGVDVEELVRSRRLSLMSESELRELSEEGFDLQLHTHRHRFPRDEQEIQSEIEDNRAVLEPIVGKRLEHFCYPSGVWYPDRTDTLASLGIRSATTCDEIFSRPGESHLALRRFCDGHAYSLLEFESIVTGFRIHFLWLIYFGYWLKERFEK